MKYWNWSTKSPPPLCRLKLVYSYVIEVADFEYQLFICITSFSFKDKRICSNKIDNRKLPYISTI